MLQTETKDSERLRIASRYVVSVVNMLVALVCLVGLSTSRGTPEGIGYVTPWHTGWAPYLIAVWVTVLASASGVLFGNRIASSVLLIATGLYVLLYVFVPMYFTISGAIEDNTSIDVTGIAMYMFAGLFWLLITWWCLLPSRKWSHD